MVIPLLLMTLLQTLPKADLVREGHDAGRLGEALAVCGRQGYPVDELVAEDLANRFAARAVEAGWSRETVSRIIEAGVARERSTIPFSEPLYDLPADELIDAATGLSDDVRAYCHSVNDVWPGAITDLEVGDRVLAERSDQALRKAAASQSRQ
ncbi:hypothetical protein [Brevundimonas nasdae]|uniref:Uncharacterized protein n=1 Tax=Brevundimonas nasdae TaxID=172043 RepID=A0ABX8TKE4_9CAUL|nr:hypothetical protein [Brevundimonas nasdae]QYC11479.1 hypothetical protein KWG56_05750 [Brevundimonas nasdae]QYC14267.1 hypothetical protein KWG63_01085 [Brevundimonas nasdae]